MEILEDDLVFFQSNTSAIVSALSAHLQQTSILLSKLLSADSAGAPSTNYSTTSDISKLLPNAGALQTTIATQTAAISSTRLRITELADQIHAQHREILEAAVRILEQTVHGSVARGVKAKAEHLAVVAKGLNFKIQYVSLFPLSHTIPTSLRLTRHHRILEQADPLMTDAALNQSLQSYNSHLNSVERGLTARKETASTALQEYERTGSGMAEIAKRYAEVVRECEGVKADIARLDKNGK
jgi:diphthamide biosynthesis protein 3